MVAATSVVTRREFANKRFSGLKIIRGGIFCVARTTFRHSHMGGKDSKQQEPPPPEPSSGPEPAPEPVKAAPPPVKATAKPTMSEPAAPPEAKEYPEFPGEKLSKR